MNKIKIGIVGYGNLGRGVEAGIRQNPDMELTAVFTRRAPESVSIQTPSAQVVHTDDMAAWKDRIDVLILCGGSMKDIPEQGPQFAAHFNTVDGFDTHADIPSYFESMDAAGKSGQKISIIASGWDPGLFSLNRLFGNAILPTGKDFTFWGRGVSQGHSDAIRMIDGVIDARQYTIPVEAVLEEVRQGSMKDYETREKHTRLCYVVAEEGADLDRITREIQTMPKYFADYDTTVHFISAEELLRDHNTLPHGGFVMRSGTTGFANENKQLIEFKLQLDSNPEFTANVLIAYARAAHRMHAKGITGAHTVFDVAPGLLMLEDAAYLRKHLL